MTGPIRGLSGPVFAASWFHPATRQGHSRQDQGDARERGHGDALSEDQDAEHDRNYWQQVRHVEATVAPSLVMIW
jgi:hypothetical protein